MKVSCITRHAISNYGSLLQAYATQRAVESLGHEFEIMDYVPACEDVSQQVRTLLSTKPSWNGNPLKKSVYRLLMEPETRVAGKRFARERSQLLKMSPHYASLEELKANPPKADVYMTGSDQVWGPGKEGINPDSIYFLSFADDNQKYSYAASFGVADISDVKAMQLRPLLKNFQSFSVREKSALNIVKKITGKNGVCHIDPTLLLNKDEWQKISVKKIDKPYILVFNVKPVKSLIDFAEKLSKKTGIPVVYITDNPQKKRKNFTYVSAPTVEEFLGYFANADYTVTNSFHGTAFSVIFHKNMFVEYETAKGFNHRAKNLLQTIGINREIKDGEAVTTDIDWNKVDNILQAERKHSLDYLKDIIKGE